MERCFSFLVVFMVFSAAADAQFWSGIHNAGVQEILKNFENPEPEYGPNLLWGWNGSVDSSVIDNDLDRILKMAS